MKKLYFLLCLLVITATGFSQTNEPFNYTPDAALGLSAQSGAAWLTTNSGDSILITAGSLNYSGLAASTGNKVEWTGSGTDYFRLVFSAGQTAGTVYASFLLNVTSMANVTAATGDYFAGYTQGSSSSQIGSAVWIKQGATATEFNIGISTRSNSVVNYSTQALTVGTTYLIVIGYQFNPSTQDDVAMLWLNPTSLGGTAPAPDLTSVPVTGTSADMVDVKRFLLRQGSSTLNPSLQFDELRVALDWATVTPTGAAASGTLSASSLTGFGNACINTTAGPNSFTITGSNLSTADVTVGPLAGYTFSTTSGGTYTNSLTLTQPGGSYSQQVFVKFNPTAAQSYNGNIPVSGGGATAINVAATGTGENVTVSAPTPATQTVCTGGAGAISVTASGGTSYSYQWYSNATNSNTGGALISGATSNTYTPPSASTGTTYYYVVVTPAGSSCGLVTSSTATVTVNSSPNATISYSGSPYCSNAGSATVTQTGTTGGTYTSTTGLAINSATGDITTGASTPGTYTVTYTVPASGGCTLFTTTTSVTINAAPSATISYSGSPYCSTAGSATVTQTGTTGGTYSSTSGLTINSTTGAINVSTSTPGTYTVTYTVPAGNGCATYTTTAPVTITATPNASISYTGSPYCTNAGSANVTQTGTTGGIYSAPAGLSINSATGSITTSASTAGTYTVTYTVAAAGGCTVYTTTAPVTITTAPSATISYPGTPFCSNASSGGSVTQTGTNGGTYSSTTGLNINTTTGAVNIGASTPGTYTVTYTVPAGNGCVQYQTTAPITINATPATPTITAVGTTQLQSSSATGNQWYLNNVLQAAFTTQTITPIQSGNYTVIVTTNGCSSASSAAFNFVLTAINIVNLDNSITVAPNPVQSKMNIRVNGVTGTMSVRILTTSGVEKARFVKMSGSRAIDMSGYAPGIYVVEITNERTGEKVQKKVVKM